MAAPNTSPADSQAAGAGGRVAACGLGRREEHRQRGADDEHGSPGGAGDILVDPHPAQHQHEDQLGDQNGLDDRHRAVVQRESLEGVRAHRGRGPQQPQRLPGQVEGQPPALLALRGADARLVLRYQIDRVGEGSGQRENDGQSHARVPVPLASADRVATRLASPPHTVIRACP
jgi:hypothetical protein